MAQETTMRTELRNHEARSVRNDSRSIQVDLQRKISAKHWKPGDKLPSRRQLATEYGVALATIERACSTLISDGLLVATGRGTLVSENENTVGKETVLPGSSANLLDGASVGVVNTLDCGDTAHPDGNGWAIPVISALEGAIANMGGRTVPFYRSEGRNSLGDAANYLLARNVDAIVVIGLSAMVPLNDHQSIIRNSAVPYVCVTAYDFHRRSS
jgi:hypothetical protein